MKFTSIILAAGKGTRMKSELPKALHPVCGRPMIHFPIQVAEDAGAGEIITVIGHGAESVKDGLSDKKVSFVIQEKQLGTAHAVRMAEGNFRGFDGDILVLAGDIPLVSVDLIRNFIRDHQGSCAKISVMTAVLNDPGHYGRIVRNGDGGVLKIVEFRDATQDKRSINEINTGIYCVDAGFLFEKLGQIGSGNAQAEYYLTDIVEIAARENKVNAFRAPDPDEVCGINSREDLMQVERGLRLKICKRLMAEGVRIVDPDSTYIDESVSIGTDTEIFPNTFIEGETVIGNRCRIEASCTIRGSRIGDGTVVKACSYLESAVIGKGTQIGPFAHLRPESVIGDGARVGNFVEIKKSSLGKNTKASHLAYIGDAEIGERVNMGCGVITVNYDGKNKYRTIVEDDAFVGSDSQLVAPVRIGKGAYVACGSSIN